jgi:preprotein translocase subunit SecA
MVHVRDYLGQYQRLAGMTGTAVTDALTYQKIYHLDVVPVPAGKPVIRVDHPDAVYRTTQAKLAVLADEAAARHATGQPVLIGATSSEEAETVSGLLARRGISHEVLTGADDERDAQAITGVGRRSAVTIIAGMAGRGVGIRLGGATGAGHAEIAGLGGLCVLGTQRPACRRHELELRDRAGCQGDPGEATYFLSIDDDRIKRLLPRRAASLLTRANRSPGLSELIDNVQAWAAVSEAEQLGQILSYQSVLADQQLLVYARRRAVFTGEGLRDRIRSMIDEVIRARVATAAGEHAEPAQLWRELRDLYPVAVTPEALAAQCGCTVAALTPQFIATQVAADAQRAYDRREAELGEPLTREFERRLTMWVIDRAWCEHLQAMSDLLDDLATRSADGTVPLPDYQREAALLFAAMESAVNREIIYGLFNFEVTVEES